jgi:5'-nucleotidase
MRRISLLLCTLWLAACGDDAVTQAPDAAVAPDALIADAAVIIEHDAELEPDAAPAPPVHVQVLAFNDFHGNLEAPGGSSGTVITEVPTSGPPVTVPAGGAAFLADHIAALRAENPNTVVVTAGDNIGASPLLSALFHDEPTIEALNLIGVDIAAVGNHEFDEGGAELLRMQFGGCHPQDGCADGTGFAGARFEYLAANVVVDPETDRTFFPRYTIREFEGIPVAFIGMTLEATPTIVTPLGVGGLEFRDEVDTVNALVPELEVQGVHAIVVLLHEGGFQTGLYDQCVGLTGPIVDIATQLDPAVDLIVSGHTHAAYNCEIAGKRVTSALSFGRLVTKIDLVLDPATRDVASIDAENTIVTRDGAGSAAMTALVARYLAIVAPLRDRVVGSLTGPLGVPRPPPGGTMTPAGESTMGDVIADSQLLATRAPGVGGAQIAFMNPGGVRADLAAGNVTFGAIFSVQPFGNSLVVMTLTGAQLRTLLEQQFTATATRVLQPSAGFSYTWSTSAAVGAKVDAASMKLDGVAIDPAASYRVTVNSFLATGGDGFFVLRDGTSRVGGVVDLQALEAYFTAESPVSPPAQDRITLVP